MRVVGLFGDGRHTTPPNSMKQIWAGLQEQVMVRQSETELSIRKTVYDTYYWSQSNAGHYGTTSPQMNVRRCSSISRHSSL